MLTVKDFKDFFKRDFPYLPTYDELKAYRVGDEVYYEGEFYVSKVDQNNSNPADITVWDKVRDDELNYILDEDIQRSIDEATIVLPASLGAPKDVIQLLKLYLSAHLLCDFINTSAQGLVSHIGGIITGKSVGSVSQQYGLPTNLMNNENFSFYMYSRYGLKYLSLILPYLRGGVSVVGGATLP